MDKPQSDHIDNVIRQAAENISTPFNEEAWKKMEVLLDKEFRKDRRRPAVIWWWSLLVLLAVGSAGYYYFNYGHTGTYKDHNTLPVAKLSPHSDGEKIRDEKDIILPHQHSAPAAEPAANTAGASVNAQRSPLAVTVPGTTNAGKHTKQVPHGLELIAYNKKGVAKSGRMLSGAGKLPEQKEPAERNDNALTGSINNIAMDNHKQNEKATNRQSESEGSNPDHTNTAQGVLPAPIPKSSTAGDTAAAVTKKLKAPVTLMHNKQSRGVYFIVSAARSSTDVKGLSLNNLGYIFGGGIGYQLSNRWRVQTGIYAGKEIYKAGPDDYHSKVGSLYNISLKTVNADCYIYNIPVSVRYDVIHKKTFNLYGMAGVSSAILKRERYMYHYNDVNGRYGFLDSTYKGNTDFLSDLNLSVGFEQQVARGLYIQAEPYIKVPLSGIGEGSIKLYNAGFQVGIRYQPANKNKKH